MNCTVEFHDLHRSQSAQVDKSVSTKLLDPLWSYIARSPEPWIRGELRRAKKVLDLECRISVEGLFWVKQSLQCAVARVVDSRES